jgi:Domain of unknown function (DUF4349)
MDPRRDGFDLTEELRALRPEPRPAFAAELDRRAAGGFSKRSRLSGTAPERLGRRLRALSPRKVLVPVTATAVLALAVATVVVTTTQTGDEGGLGETHFSDAPAVTHSSDAPAAAAESVQPTKGSAAATAGNRAVERGAELTLRAQPNEFGAPTKEVFAVVHAANGIVLSSSIHDRAGGGEASARFALLIPSAKLGDTLASLSRIAEVRSRHESTLDITAPTVSVGELLEDSEARIDGLLAQLASAESDGERAAVEAELRRERSRAAALRSRLDRLRQRAQYARVSLRIESGNATGGTDAGRWGVGDALDDAGRILATAAAVAVVALAIVAPLALIVLLAWLANRAWVHRRRERALG